jgi:hypothetical protein
LARAPRGLYGRFIDGAELVPAPQVAAMPHSNRTENRSGPSTVDVAWRVASPDSPPRSDRPSPARLAPAWRATLFAVAVVVAAGCGEDAALASVAPAATSKPAVAPTEQNAASAPAVLADRSTDAWRLDLLDLAYGAASALPVDPHVKTRSRLQEDCVRAVLALGQTTRALRYAEGIVDWRRAAAYAAYAIYAAENGAKAEARRAAQLAELRLREHAAAENAQDWQRDRVLALLATMHRKSGDVAEARRIGAALDPAEAAAWRADEAEAAASVDASREMDALAEALRVGGLDQARGALAAAVKVFEARYGEPALRDRAAEMVATGFAKLPPDLRVGYLLDLSGAAGRRGDRAAASRWIDRAKSVVDGERWLPGDHVRLFARLSLARAAAGDAARARDEAENGRAVFEAQRKKIPDFERAEALAPLAEAYFAAGDLDAARTHWKRAVEEASLNPNGRPRAEDFVGIVVALVRSGPEPEASTTASVKALRAGLVAPW